MTVTTCHAIRHGETRLNREARLQGSSDSGLTALGRAQVFTAAAALPAIRRVFCSPLLRARQSADIVARVHGVSVHVDERLRERSFGELESAHGPTLLREQPVLAGRIRGDATYTPPGGESELTVRGRAADFLAHLVDAGLAEGTVVVVHGGWFTAATRHLTASGGGMPATGAVTRLTLDVNGRGSPRIVDAVTLVP